ncbi:MAG: ADP-ribosylation factor-like protein [Promethearchaeota archaeon]
MGLEKSKIVLIGEAGVGKSTLLGLLLEKRNLKSPTIGLEIENSILNGTKCAIWDLSGQERFKFLWNDFLKGAGLTVLVCDSTEENVEKTREICERYARKLGSRVIAIANKQDLAGAMSADEVEARLGIKTYGMSAIRREMRDKMRSILESEVSN